jgi:outer membrane lipoprotein SlyB
VVIKDQKMNIRVKAIALLVALPMALGGCAKQLSSSVYTGASAGEVSETYRGIVVSVKQVRIQDKDYLEQNNLGTGVGGLAGAAIGSGVGKGKGNNAAVIGGAIIGAVAGAFAEKALKEQDALEIVVELENGDIRTVVQGTDVALSPGQKVYLMVSSRTKHGSVGRSRVVPRQN